MLTTEVMDQPGLPAPLPCRVVIGDDHELVLEGIARILHDHCTLVGRANDGRALVELVEQHHPDCVLVDISMPSLNGVEAIRRIRMMSPETKVIVVTQHNDRQYMRAAFAAGAVGYVLKHAAASELLEALKTTSAGQYYVSPSL